MNDHRRSILIAALLSALTASGCEPTEESSSTADLDSDQLGKSLLDAEPTPGIYATTFSTDPMPISIALEGGMRAEGVGATTIRQILRLTSNTADEVAVANCAGEQVPFAVYLEESLATAEESANLSCSETPLTSHSGDEFSWRSQCESGFTQLKLIKLPDAATDSWLTFDMGTRDERYTETEPGCLETFSFDGINSFYRGDELLSTFPVATSHLSLTLATNSGPLTLEFLVTGEFSDASYSWGHPVDTVSTPGNRFQLTLSGDHPWALATITDGNLMTRHNNNGFELEFTAERQNAPPLDGRIRAQLIGL